MFELIASQERKVPQVPESIMPAVLLQEQGRSVELADLSEAPLSQEVFDDLRLGVLDRQSMTQKENAYHNHEHTKDVERRFLELAEMLDLRPREIQLGRIAALFHDDGHCGDTIRQDSVRGSYISNEEYAAYVATENLKDLEGFTEDDITFVQSAILSTSFGQADPDHPYQRNYDAHHPVESLLKFADVASFIDGADAAYEDSKKLQAEGVLPHMSQQETARGAQAFMQEYVSQSLAKLVDQIRGRCDEGTVRKFVSVMEERFESTFEALEKKRLAH